MNNIVSLYFTLFHCTVNSIYIYIYFFKLSRKWEMFVQFNVHYLRVGNSTLSPEELRALTLALELFLNAEFYSGHPIFNYIFVSQHLS